MVERQVSGFRFKKFKKFKEFKFMKKIFILSFFALLLSSCDKVPINGALDGMWQLTTIQTPQETRDVKATRAYLSIQLHLSQWDHTGTTFYAHFAHEGDSIRFYDFTHASLHRDKNDDDEWITAEEMRAGIMDAWGIHSLDARYRTRQLDSDALVLECADTVLYFRKL